METEAKTGVKRRLGLVIQGAIGVLLGSLILYLVFRRVSPLVLLDELAHVDIAKLAWAILFISLSYVCRSALWKTLMQRFHSYRYGAVFRSVMVGYLANNILPVRLGDAIRGTFLYLAHGGNTGFIFGSLALERVLDIFLILVLLGTLSFSLDLHYAWLIRSAIILVAAIVIFFIVGAALRHIAHRDLSSIPTFLEKIKAQVSRFITRNLVLNLGNSMSLGNTLRGLPWLIITWFVTFWGLYFTLDSMGMTHQIGVLPVALILCFSSLGMAVPSLPASLGTYQAIFIFGAVIVGISESTALSASFLYQVLWVVITSVLGLISMAWEGVSFGEVLRQVRRR